MSQVLSELVFLHQMLNLWLLTLTGSLESADGSRNSINKWTKITSTNSWRWCLGLIYIVAVAGIWIAASYIVQSVVDAGVSPFLITYICNSLFVVYIPIVEAARYFEDSIGDFWTKLKFKDAESLQQASDLESVNLLQSGGHEISVASDQAQTRPSEDTSVPDTSFPAQTELGVVACSKGLDAKGRWTHARVAKVSMLISPFWFLAQLTFNLSLRYTTVTVSVTKKSLMLLPYFIETNFLLSYH
jgi:solute carrier family 35 protein F5